MSPQGKFWLHMNTDPRRNYFRIPTNQEKFDYPQTLTPMNKNDSSVICVHNDFSAGRVIVLALEVL